VLEYHHLPEIIKLVANTFQELVTGLASAKKQLNLKEHSKELLQVIDIANINLEYVANLCERQGSEDLANYYTQVAFNAYARCKVNSEELTRLVDIAMSDSSINQANSSDAEFFKGLGVCTTSLKFKVHNLEVMKFQFELISEEEKYKEDAWIIGRLRAFIQD